jgi:hypothetical protein
LILNNAGASRKISATPLPPTCHGLERLCHQPDADRRLFHGLGVQPRLFIRVPDVSGQWLPWTMFMPRAAFHVGDLFHNPHNNLALAHQNLVDHLSADIQAMSDDEDVRELVTYQLVDRLARSVVGIDAQQYQFQLRLVPAYALPDEDMVVLTSPVQTASPSTDDIPTMTSRP